MWHVTNQSVLTEMSCSDWQMNEWNINKYVMSYVTTYSQQIWSNLLYSRFLRSYHIYPSLKAEIICTSPHYTIPENGAAYILNPFCKSALTCWKLETSTHINFYVAETVACNRQVQHAPDSCDEAAHLCIMCKMQIIREDCHRGAIHKWRQLNFRDFWPPPPLSEFLL